MSIHLRGPVTNWQVDPALSEFVSGYVRYDVKVPAGLVLRDAFFPGSAVIRIQVDGPDWSMRIGARVYPAMPRTSFTGPTSYACYLESGGGTMVGIALHPAGWVQLFGGDASRYANRLITLAQLDVGAGLLQEALEDGEDLEHALNDWLLARVARRGGSVDPKISLLQQRLDDPATTRIEAIADELSLSPRALATFSRHHFGFTPKVLLRRARFLRALRGMLTDKGDAARHITAAGYWDRSHFLRDSHLFLGCSIREFNKRRGVFSQLAPRDGRHAPSAAA